MKRQLSILFVVILVTLGSTAAYSDITSKESAAAMVVMEAKFEYLDPATQVNQSGIPSYQKIFNIQDINIVNGAVNFTQTDLTIPGRHGLDLVIARTYNSRQFSSPASLISDSMKQRMDLVAQNVSPEGIINIEKEHPKNDYFYAYAGHGWEFNFGARLIAITYTCETKELNMPADQLIVQADNATVRFEKKDGIFRAVDKGIFMTISASGDGFTLYDRDGTAYLFKDAYFDKYFSLSGQIPDQIMTEKYYLLNRIEDPNGNQINFKNTEYDGKRSGETRVKQTRSYSPTLSDMKIIIGFDAKNVEFSLAGMGAALLNPINWLIGTILFTIAGNTATEYTFWETAGYIYTPKRVTEIIDTCGRKYRIKYNDSSQILSIGYLSSYDEPISIDYSYSDSNLSGIELPENIKTTFNYQYFSQNLDDSFDDKGYLLNGITYPTGANAIYDYSWSSPAVPNRNDFSFYLVNKKTLDNNSWSYQYSGGSVYNKHSGKPSDGRFWSFDNVQVTDPFQQSSKYEITDNLITKTIDPSGNCLSSQWDTEEKHKISCVKMSDGRYYKQYFKYDRLDNCIEVNDLGDTGLWQDDRNIIFEYDGHDMTRSYIECGINKYNDKTFCYDDKGNIIRSDIFNDGIAASYFYDHDRSGNIIRQIEPDGNITTIEYTNNASPVKIIKNGLATAMSYYFSSGLLKSRSVDGGEPTTYLYDNIGRQVSAIDPGSTERKWEYEKDFITGINENGGRTVFDFDGLGRLDRIFYPDGSSKKYSYDSLSRLTIKSDQLDRQTKYQYDGSGRLIRINYPDGSFRQFAYQGGRIDAINEINKRWSYYVDGRDNILQVIEPDGRSVRNAFDPADHIISATDQKYRTTKYDYDGRGSLLRIFRPDNSAYSFGYDRLGRLATRTYPDGKTTRYSYDPLSRFSAVAYDDRSSDIAYKYDGERLSEVKDAVGTVSYDYDKMGRTISQKRNIGNAAFMTNYAYDKTGNITGIDYPSGIKAAFSYNNMGSLIGLILAAKKGPVSIARIDTLPNRLVKKIEFSNGISQIFEFDKRDRITGIKVERNGKDILLDYRYGYDAAGNMTSFRYSHGEEFRYEYDSLDRLARIKYPFEADSVFSYDETGNRTRLKYAYGEAEYLYNPKNDHVDMFRDAGIETKTRFDACGDLLEEQNNTESRKYTYDVENRVAQASISNHNLNHHLSFSYDFSGRLAVKSGDNYVGIRHYDNSGNLLAITGPDGNALASYVYANGIRICEIEPSGSLHFIINDPFGSPILVLDGTGSVECRYLYDPFGGIFASKEERETSFKFTGKEYLPELDLYHFGARLYDPSLGRFLSEDRAEPDRSDPQSLNRYVYCMNSPLKYVDIDALESYLVHGIWAGNLKDAYSLRDSLTKKGVPDVMVFEWSGRKLADIAGDLGEAIGELSGFNTNAAGRLADFIAGNHRQGEPINLISHSAGCRISINAAKILDSKYDLKVDRLFMMAGPIGMTGITNVGKTFNMMSVSEKIGSIGDSPLWDIAFPYMSLPSYALNWGSLKHVYFSDIGHTGWFSSPDVEKFLIDNVKI